MVDKKRVILLILILVFACSLLSSILVIKNQYDHIIQQCETEIKMQEELLEERSAVEELMKRLEQIETTLDSMNSSICRDVNVRSIAHRGASEIAPENTLPAFILAKELGFSCVETDIRFTADNIPVCIHDACINRTSNGIGDVSSLKLEDIRQYDFGAWKDEKYRGTTILTFEEFISLCKNIGVHPYIELKEGNAEQIRKIVETANQYGMRGKVIWISFDRALLEIVRAFDDKARLGYLTSDFDHWTIVEIQGLQSGKNEVFLDSYSCDEAIVEECRKAGIPLELWTINKEETFAEINPYVTGVTSDSLRYGQYLFNTSMNR